MTLCAWKQMKVTAMIRNSTKKANKRWNDKYCVEIHNIYCYYIQSQHAERNSLKCFTLNTILSYPVGWRMTRNKEATTKQSLSQQSAWQRSCGTSQPSQLKCKQVGLKHKLLLLSKQLILNVDTGMWVSFCLPASRGTCDHIHPPLPLQNASLFSS